MATVRQFISFFIYDYCNWVKSNSKCKLQLSEQKVQNWIKTKRVLKPFEEVYFSYRTKISRQLDRFCSPKCLSLHLMTSLRVRRFLQVLGLACKSSRYILYKGLDQWNN